MQVSKAVDMATVNLMQLAMEARMQPTGNELPLVADIHFIGSVDSEDGLHTFTFLRIHLESVEIKGWSISGSGDERPTESLTLGYEKAAMCYQSTPDGRLKDPKIKAGWDQKANKTWDTTSSYYPDFPD